MINDNVKIAVKIANELNYQNLYIPLIDGFKVRMKFENGFLAANNQNFTERFVTSNIHGAFDDLIEKDINSTISYCKKHNIIIDDKNIIYYGTYNYYFKYKVYLRDILVNNNSFIREVYAYFINERNNSFNIISLSTSLISINENNTLKDFNDISDNKLAKYLLDSIMIIIENVK